MLSANDCRARLFTNNKTTMSSFEVIRSRSATMAATPCRHLLPANRVPFTTALQQDHTMRFVALRADDTIASFHSPVLLEDPATDPPTPTLVAMAGDSIAGDQYVALPPSAMSAVTLNLMSAANATRMGTVRSGAAVTDLCNALGEAIPVAALPWENDAYPHSPVLVPLGTVLSVPPTFSVPHGFHIIRDALPAPVLGDDGHPNAAADPVWGHMRSVFPAWKHAARQYGGASLQSPALEDRFAAANWTGDGVGATTVTALNDSLVASIYTPVRFLLPSDPLVAAAIPLIRERQLAMLQYEADSLAVPAAPAPAAPAVAADPGAAGVPAALGGLVEFLQDSQKGSMASDRKKKYKRAQKQWSLFFGSSKKGDDDVRIYQPAVLTDDFNDFLANKDPVDSVLELQTGMEEAKQQDKVLNGLVGRSSSFNPGVITKPMAKAFQSCLIHPVPLVNNIDVMNRHLCSFNFLPCNFDNPYLRSADVNERRDFYNDLHGDTADEDLPKQKDLFIDGETTSSIVIGQTNLNLQLFGLYAVGPAFKDSVLGELLSAHYALLDSVGGERYLSMCVGSNSIMIHNHLLDINQFIFAVYSTMIGNPRWLRLLTVGSVIPAEPVLQLIHASCSHVMTNFRSAITGQDFMYRQPAPTMKWFESRESVPAALSTPLTSSAIVVTPPKKRKDAHNADTSANKRGSSGTPGVVDEAVQRGRGIFVCSQPPLAHFPHNFKGLNGKPLCTNFCTKGYWCRHPDSRCHRAHVTHTNQIPSDELSGLAAWEAETPNMAFNTGMKPKNLGSSQRKP